MASARGYFLENLSGEIVAAVTVTDLGIGVRRGNADPGVRPQPGPRLPDYCYPRALRPGLGV